MIRVADISRFQNNGGIQVNESTGIETSWFPEIGAGGSNSLDGTIEFYNRINALLAPEMVILDFGAGRGAALSCGAYGFKKRLMTFRGKVARVVACDVDEVLLENSGADETVVIQPDVELPFADRTFDLIVADYVFEHIVDPVLVSAELRRILRPGGWICACTPNLSKQLNRVSEVAGEDHMQYFVW